MKDNVITIRIIESKNILSIVPLLQKLGNNAVPEDLIKERLLEMVAQNYECLGIFDDEVLIGTCGLWFQTYAKKNSCNWIELNSYVHNFPSHKFFYNQGFVAKGYHFVKELN